MSGGGLCDMGNRNTTRNRAIRAVLGSVLFGSVAMATAVTPLSFLLQDQGGRKTTDPPLASRGKLGQDLFMAIDRRDLAAVEALIKKGADPNSTNGLEFTPLYIAAASHQPDVMKALLAGGAKADMESSYGTPLTFAAATGHTAGVKMLIEKGVDPNLARNDGMTVLMMAANAGNPETVAELLKHKVDVNALDDNDTSALALAARGGHVPVAKMLLDAGAKVDVPDYEGITPLMAAAVTGRAAIVDQLLKAGANVNAKDAQGRNALRLAVGSGDYPEVVRALVTAGSEDKDLSAALASKKGFKKSAALLGKPTATASAKVGRVVSAREAIPMSLKTMQASMAEFSKNTNCLSCHQEGLGRMVLGSAKERGFQTDKAVEETHSKKLAGMMAATKPLHEGALKDPEVMKQVPLIEMNEVTPAYSWLLAGMAAQSQPATAGASEMAMVLGRQQAPTGAWTFSMPRLPMQSSLFTMTALSVRSLRAYGPKESAQEIDERIAKAKAWMLREPARTSEDRASRLLGLLWAGAPISDRSASVSEIVKDQQADGGWAQMPGMASDAYATGQALYALSKGGGMAASNPVFKKGIEFLLRTQDEDGTWFVNKRAIPANNYFDAKFPHGQSQYASFNGTAWATMALLETLPRK